MTDMRMIWKTTGLCLVVMFAVSMTLVGTAQAKWEQCSEGGSATKYSEHQCTKVEGGGKWQWNEVVGTEEVRVKGSLVLKDTKTLAGTSEVECSGEWVGAVGPGPLGKIKEVKVSAAQCRQLKVCENVEEVEARDLPWQTEMYETEGKRMETIKGDGGGEPGWKIKCKTVIGAVTDECLSESGKPESLLLENKSSGSELLVLATLRHARKAKCSQGGAESGETTGSLAVSKANGSGLRVAPGVNAPSAPETSCPITSEGVTFDAVVTTGNEGTLRENVLNSTWGPEGENGECKTVSEFDADVTGGKITAGQKTEYQKAIEEFVVPGAYIYIFQWHKTGGSSFKTLGVVSAAGKLELEPIGFWSPHSPTHSEATKEQEEKEGLVDITARFPTNYANAFVTTALATITLKISTPDNKKITAGSESTNIAAANHYVGVSLTVEKVSEKIKAEGGGLECYESKIKERFTQYFGLLSEQSEEIPTLCGDGKAIRR